MHGQTVHIQPDFRAGLLTKMVHLAQQDAAVGILFPGDDFLRKGRVLHHRQAPHRMTGQAHVKRKLIGADQCSGVHSHLPDAPIVNALIHKQRVEEVLQILHELHYPVVLRPRVDRALFNAAVLTCHDRLVSVGCRLCIGRRLPEEVCGKIPHTDALTLVDALEMLFQAVQRTGQGRVLRVQRNSAGIAEGVRHRLGVDQIEGFSNRFCRAVGRAAHRAVGRAITFSGAIAPGGAITFGTALRKGGAVAGAVSIADTVAQRFCDGIRNRVGMAGTLGHAMAVTCIDAHACRMSSTV